MSIKSRILTVINKLRGTAGVSETFKTALKTISNDSAPVAHGKRRHIPPPPPERIVLDMAHVMQWHREGLGSRTIARRLGNVSHTTVRRNIVAYEAAPAPEVQQPVQPIQPEKDGAAVQPVPAAIVTPQIACPVAAIEAYKPPSNFAELDAIRKARYGDGFPLDLVNVFLTRPEHLQYGLGSEQPCIAFDRWHQEYRGLEMFQPPRQFWVLVNAEDGSQVNRPWLESIAADDWLRERCLVLRIGRGGVLAVFKARYSAHWQYPPLYYGTRLADETFERWHQFEPMPLHHHTKMLDALTEDAVLPAMPLPATDYSSGWTAPQPMPPQASYDADVPRRSEGAGGLAGTGFTDEPDWK